MHVPITLAGSMSYNYEKTLNESKGKHGHCKTICDGGWNNSAISARVKNLQTEIPWTSWLAKPMYICNNHMLQGLEWLSTY